MILDLNVPKDTRQLRYLQVSHRHVTDDNGKTICVFEEDHFRPVVLPGAYFSTGSTFRQATQAEFDYYLMNNPDDRIPNAFDWNAAVYKAVLALDSNSV